MSITLFVLFRIKVEWLLIIYTVYGWLKEVKKKGLPATKSPQRDTDVLTAWNMCDVLQIFPHALSFFFFKTYINNTKSCFKKMVWEFVTSPSRTLPDHKLLFRHRHYFLCFSFNEMERTGFCEDLQRWHLEDSFLRLPRGDVNNGF